MRASVATTPPARRRIRPFLPRQTNKYQPTTSTPSSAVRPPRSSSCASPRRPAAGPPRVPTRPPRSHPESLFASELKRAPSTTNAIFSAEDSPMTRHPSKPRALRPVKTTRDSTRRWTRSGRGRDLDLRDNEEVVRAAREAADTLALENASLRPRALLSAAERNRAPARTAPPPLRRPARCDARAPSRAFVNPQKNALATARPPQVGRVVSLPLETTRRRGAPSGRSPTVVTSRDVGSATRRAGFDGASASASRLREAAEVVSAMDATLERASDGKWRAAGRSRWFRGGARRTERVLSRCRRTGTGWTGQSARGAPGGGLSRGRSIFVQTRNARR